MSYHEKGSQPEIKIDSVTNTLLVTPLFPKDRVTPPEYESWDEYLLNRLEIPNGIETKLAQIYASITGRNVSMDLIWPPGTISSVLVNQIEATTEPSIKTYHSEINARLREELSTVNNLVRSFYKGDLLLDDKPHVHYGYSDTGLTFSLEYNSYFQKLLPHENKQVLELINNFNNQDVIDFYLTGMLNHWFKLPVNNLISEITNNSVDFLNEQRLRAYLDILTIAATSCDGELTIGMRTIEDEEYRDDKFLFTVVNNKLAVALENVPEVYYTVEIVNGGLVVRKADEERSSKKTRKCITSFFSSLPYIDYPDFICKSLTDRRGFAREFHDWNLEFLDQDWFDVHNKNWNELLYYFSNSAKQFYIY